MSVLDMFASALGAFIIVTIILFPYFNAAKRLEKVKTDIETKKEQLTKVKGEVESSNQIIQLNNDRLEHVPTTVAALGKCQERINSCKAEVTTTFLIVGVEWSARCDIDLRVIDPANRQFDFGKRSHTGSEAQFSIDMRDGPGIEVWQNPKADPGDYKIRYNIASCMGGVEANAGIVKAWVIDRSAGRSSLPDLRMADRRSGDIATVAIRPDGSIAIRPAR